MKFLAAFIIGCFFFLSCQPDQRGEKKEGLLTEAEVKDFVNKYDRLWADRDTTGMKQAMDEKYIYFTSTGSTIGRNDIMNWFTPADKYKIEKADRTEVRVQVNGNTAIVSSRWVGNGSFDGEKFNDDQRCGLVIQKKNGRLILVSEHCTQITK